jgi:TetR/AcrR family acrAB operon transcriptional repressor
MRRTKAEAAETRAAILVAAEKMFFEKGVAESTLEEIAAAAGVTRGAIYWHFDSKVELFLELYNAARLPQINVIDFDRVEEDGGDLIGTLEKVTLDMLAGLEADVSRQRIVTILLRMNFTSEFDKLQAAIETIKDEHDSSLLEVLRKAEKAGELATPWTPETAARSIKWLMKGMCWEWLLGRRTFPLNEAGSQCISLLFAAFRGKCAAVPNA